MIKTASSLVEKQLEMSKYIGKRKHSSQLKQNEIDTIYARLREVEESGDNWRIRTHALDRLSQKGIKATYNDIVSTIYNSSIIEYKIDYNNSINRCDERVVIRGNARANKHYNLNVVFSISERRIVTVWLNHVNDKHDTLDWSIYDEDMKVFVG